MMRAAALLLLALTPFGWGEAVGHDGLETGGVTVPAEPSGQVTLEVWLVRHAEKVDDSADPPLSDAGKTRAALLAQRLSEAGIQHIHTTDYQRTRETAAPLAIRLGVELQLYDPRDLHAFAQALREEGGVHLVVGHSNTTPEMVSALGGNPLSPIDDAEYDRLYRVIIGADGTVETQLRRFGTRYGGG